MPANSEALEEGQPMTNAGRCFLAIENHILTFDIMSDTDSIGWVSKAPDKTQGPPCRIVAKERFSQL